jgi:hypothetical protein
VSVAQDQSGSQTEVWETEGKSIELNPQMTQMARLEPSTP